MSLGCELVEDWALGVTEISSIGNINKFINLALSYDLRQVIKSAVFTIQAEQTITHMQSERLSLKA